MGPPPSEAIWSRWEQWGSEEEALDGPPSSAGETDAPFCPRGATVISVDAFATCEILDSWLKETEKIIEYDIFVMESQYSKDIFLLLC